jgi:hypothetical protein
MVISPASRHSWMAKNRRSMCRVRSVGELLSLIILSADRLSMKITVDLVWAKPSCLSTVRKYLANFTAVTAAINLDSVELPAVRV